MRRALARLLPAQHNLELAALETDPILPLPLGHGKMVLVRLC